MRAGTIYIVLVCFIVPIMHLMLEVADQRCSADVCVSWTEHARLSTPCSCAFPCASSIDPWFSRQGGVPTRLLSKPSGEKLAPLGFHCRQQLIKMIFRGIRSDATVVRLLFKVITRLCR